MPRLRLVFDLDDTLYPERQFAISGFSAAGDWARQTLGDRLVGLEDEMVALLDQGKLGGLFGEVLTRRLGADIGERHRTAFIAAYRDHIPQINLFADAQRLLQHLGAFTQEDRQPIGLISDGSTEVQAGKVKALGLEGAFAHMIFTHALGGPAYSKPHPASFEAMERALGDDRTTFVYIGDNPAKDFVVPNARGWTSVQIDRPESETGYRRIHHAAKVTAGGEPRFHIRSLDELHDKLGL